MQAIKAIYRNGNIQLLSPLAVSENTELLIVIPGEEENTGISAISPCSIPSHSEHNFRAIGLSSFFGSDDNNSVDWEEVFDVKPR